MLNFRTLSFLCKPQNVRILSKCMASCGQIKEKYPLGKSAIVTGASMGIGLECVKVLLENGVMNILMSSATNIKVGEEELNKLRRKYVQSCLAYMKCDVTNCDEVKCLFDSAIDMFGGIEIVVNNAGIFNEAKWNKMVDINLKGVIYGTQFGMEYMGVDRGGKGGAIVNVASILGLAPMGGAPVYVSTKHGVIGFTRSMSMPFHYKNSCVRVMAMCPGVTETPLINKAHSVGDTSSLAKEASRELAALAPQDVCYCGLCLMQMLREGDTGSIWVTEDKEIYEVNIPDRVTIRKR